MYWQSCIATNLVVTFAFALGIMQQKMLAIAIITISSRSQGMYTQYFCQYNLAISYIPNQGILKGAYHCTVDLLYDWFGISCMATTIFVFICKSDVSKPVKQEVNSTVILPTLVFPA